MFNQSLDWRGGDDRVKGAGGHCPVLGEGKEEGTPWEGWGLTVLCCLLDASFILWGIWTQPHQVKPGQAQAVVVGELSL